MGFSNNFCGCNRHHDNDRDRDRDRNRHDVFGIDTFVDQDDFCRAVRRCNRRNRMNEESSDDQIIEIEIETEIEQ